MKSWIIICAVLMASISMINARRVLPEESTNHEDRVYVNFIKFLSALMISEPLPSETVISSIRVIMKEMMNGQPHAQGYMSLMMTSMLRVMLTPLKIQVDNILRIIMEHSENNSQMAGAAATVQEFLLDSGSKRNMQDVQKFVTSLFQPINTVPTDGDINSISALEVLLPSRPANSNRI